MASRAVSNGSVRLAANQDVGVVQKMLSRELDRRTPAEEFNGKVVGWRLVQ